MGGRWRGVHRARRRPAHGTRTRRGAWRRGARLVLRDYGWDARLCIRGRPPRRQRSAGQRGRRRGHATMPEDARLSTPPLALRLAVANPARPARSSRSRWYSLGVLAWYWDAAVGMVSIWARSETFAHGFVVAPVALWLVWQRRAELAAVAPGRPSACCRWRRCGCRVAAGRTRHGQRRDTVRVRRAAGAGTRTVLGTEVARRIAFPLGLPVLRRAGRQVPYAEADGVDRRLHRCRAQLTGIPVYREGQHFSIPTGSWSVVEACSGVRYLIASLMVGTLYAYLSYRSTTRRLVFVGVSILVPIVANWLRAYMIVMLGHLSGNTHRRRRRPPDLRLALLRRRDGLMFWIGARWREDDHAAAARVQRRKGR